MTLDKAIVLFQALTYFIAPITLSFIAFNFWRKNGVKVQGAVSSIRHVGFEDSFYQNLLLENLKDRPINILNIYIRVGNAYYIELGSYSDDPLILKPYEVKKINLKPVHAYLINMNRVSFNDIIKSKKSTIIISTTTGRYKVKRGMKINAAMPGSLFDRFIAVAQPITDDYAGETIEEAKEQEAKIMEACPWYYPLLSKLDYKRSVFVFRVKQVFGRGTE